MLTTKRWQGQLRTCQRCGHNCKRMSIWTTQYHSLIRNILDVLSEQHQSNNRIVMEKLKLSSKLISTSTDVKTEKKNPKDIAAGVTTWKGHARKCVESCCELAHKTIDQLQKIPHLAWDDHQIKPEDLEIVGALSETLLRPDLLWTVNYLARSVTQWNRARGLRLARLIGYIHHTTNNTNTTVTLEIKQ